MSRATLLAIAGIVVIVVLMGYRLGSLTPGLSQPELDLYESANSVSSIVDNPVNAPYKSAVYLVTRPLDTAFGLRLTSAVVGALSVVLFFALARKLFSSQTAIATTALFATSSLLLHTARLADGRVMLLSLLAIVSIGYALRFSKRSELAWPVAAAIIGLSIYVPGMILFIIPMALWQFRHVRRSFEQLNTPVIALSSALLGVLVVPLIISLIREPSLWRDYLGLPADLQALPEIGRGALHAAASLVAISPSDPVRWLGRQPILDVFAATGLVLGVITLLRSFRLDRSWLMLGAFLLGIAWVAVSGQHSNIIIILPFLYLVVGFGIDQLLQQWMNVFPRNPIARTAGKALLLSAILLAINFQVVRYFVAWPNNDQTKAAFTLSLSDTAE